MAMDHVVNAVLILSLLGFKLVKLQPEIFDGIFCLIITVNWMKRRTDIGCVLYYRQSEY